MNRLLAGILLVVLASPGATKAADDLEDTLAAVSDFFDELGYLPITVPADEKVGDVYRYDGWRLVDRAENCFPSLGEVTRVETTVPLLVKTGKAEAGILAKFASFFSFSAEAKSNEQLAISYRDVQKAQVSEKMLRESLSDNCPLLMTTLSCRFDECADWRYQPIVLGTVLYARKSVYFGSTSSAEADVSVDLARLTEGLPADAKAKRLDASAAARAGFGDSSGILIESEELVPVAFQPAFLPQAVFRNHRGPGGQLETVLVGIERWVTYDPDDRVHRDIMSKLLEIGQAR